MAFDLVQAGGYGAGTLGDVVDPVGIINSYTSVEIASVDANSSTLNISTANNSSVCPFANGAEVFLYSKGGWSAEDAAYNADAQGVWVVATITSFTATGNNTATVTVNKPLTAFNDMLSFYENYSCGADGIVEFAAVTIPHYRNLTLNTGCALIPPAQGYPLAFKCSGTLTLNGGHLDLRGKGFLYSDDHPFTRQEDNGLLDTDKYAGWENSQTKDRFLINVTDGAAFILVNKLVVADDSSRIGNPDTQGVQFCRGASDSPNCPANVTNIGGSDIFLVAGSITNFTPKIIAKYRSLTSAEIANDSTVDTTIYRGLARCYIASNTRLTNDEGLYAYDCISDTDRLSTLGIHDFGDGSRGSTSIEGTVQNCYAQVTAIDSETRKTLTIGALVTGGIEAFALGTLVMVHFNHKNYNNTAHSGRFICAKIVGATDSTFTLDIAVPQTLVDNFANYNCQVVSIPQYENASCSSSNEFTPQYNGLTGGIFAVAVSDTLDLRMGGAINVEGKGRGGDGSSQLAYKAAGLRYIGNAQDNNKLPIGQGHGSVFILANKIIMDENTRIGATYSGAEYVSRSGVRSFGGHGGTAGSGTFTNTGGGYSGGTLNNPTTETGIGGYGGSGGNAELSIRRGGYGSNGGPSSDDSSRAAYQGAHIMIIADTITGFNQAAISTGGEGGKQGNDIFGGGHGSAGYGGGGACSNSATKGTGGGGGYNGGGGGGRDTNNAQGGGGGSSGWAFIYCNHAVNQDTTDTVY